MKSRLNGLKKIILSEDNYVRNDNNIEEQGIFINTNKYGKEYRNRDGKITPYHILFNDYADKILSMEKEEALSYCIKKLEKINEQNLQNKEFLKIDSQDVDDFKNKIENSTDSLDLIFNVKDIIKNDGKIQRISNKIKKRLKK
jgi:hypothetical protein